MLSADFDSRPLHTVALFSVETNRFRKMVLAPGCLRIRHDPLEITLAGELVQTRTTRTNHLARLDARHDAECGECGTCAE